MTCFLSEDTFSDVDFETGKVLILAGKLPKMIHTNLLEIKIPFVNEQNQQIKTRNNVTVLIKYQRR